MSPILLGAGGDVLEGAPALVEQGESAFAKAAQGALQGVAGVGADIEVAPVCGLFDGDEDAYSSAVVAGVSQGGQSGGGGAVEGGQGMSAGGGDVMHRARLHLGGPQREPGRAMTAWMLPPWVCALPEHHRSMTWPFTLTAGSLHRSQGMILPSRITCENPESLARSSAWRRAGACSARTAMTSSTYR